MARQDTQINVRIPEQLKAQLDEAAAANRRSLTAELVARLEQSFQPNEKLPVERDDEAWQQVRRLARTRDELTAKLTMLNTMALQLDYELRSAHVDDTSGEPLELMRKHIREVQSDAYSVRRELDRINIELNAAYSKVDGKQPTGTFKVSKAD